MCPLVLFFVCASGVRVCVRAQVLAGAAVSGDLRLCFLHSRPPVPQACDPTLYGSQALVEADGERHHRRDRRAARIPSEADFLLVWSTVPGQNDSARESEDGAYEAPLV